MGQRGRKSAADLADTKVASIERVAPPAWLSAAEKKEWREIVNRMPPTWVSRERYALLEAYCTHAVSRRLAAKKMATLSRQKEIDTEEYARWSMIHGRDTEKLKSLAIRLEIAQSTSYERNRRNQAGKPASKKPWES